MGKLTNITETRMGGLRGGRDGGMREGRKGWRDERGGRDGGMRDRKSTRLNSSH